MKITEEKGFSLIEILIVIAIIGVLASVAFVALNNARLKARDTKRKVDLSQISRLLSASTCYLPDTGAGDYDLIDLVPGLIAKYPQSAQYASFLPKDPKTGSETASNYRYEVTADNHCVLYANFENKNETITLGSLTAPTPNAGNGVLRAINPGPNGTVIYYQISK